MIKVFLDANVYFAGFVSSEGASAFVLELARKGKVTVFANRLVLREADRNLRKKASAKVTAAFHRHLKKVKIHIVPTLSEKIFSRYEALIHPKDVPVLAAAVESGAAFLLTLDRKHFFTHSLAASLNQPRIMTPGDFIRKQIRLEKRGKA